MALKAEDLKRLADLAKIKPEDLQAAITAEAETPITIAEDLQTFSPTELTTLKQNEYKRGGQAAVEIAVKDAKEKLGLDFQGKTIEGLAEAVSKKALADAKIEPEKKVQELTEKVATLQNTVKTYEAQIAEKDQEVQTIKTHSEVFKHIPTFGENAPALGQDEVLQLMKANGYSFETREGKVVAVKAGHVVADKLGEAVAVKDVVTGFLKEKKLITEEQTPGGRGGGNPNPGGKASTLSELKKQFLDQGKHLNGQEFADAVRKAQTENKDFDLNK